MEQHKKNIYAQVQKNKLCNTIQEVHFALEKKDNLIEAKKSL